MNWALKIHKSLLKNYSGHIFCRRRQSNTTQTCTKESIIYFNCAFSSHKERKITTTTRMSAKSVFLRRKNRFSILMKHSPSTTSVNVEIIKVDLRREEGKFQENSFYFNSPSRVNNKKRPVIKISIRTFSLHLRYQHPQGRRFNRNKRKLFFCFAFH